MRSVFFVLFLLFGSCVFAQDWKEIKSEHFVLYFPSQAGDKVPVSGAEPGEFAGEVLHKAEQYYGQIAEDLGYQRSSEFWTWDKRARIYLYLDHAAFVKASNHPEWAAGMADYNTKSIKSYLGSKDFADGVLPHEIAHLIFRDFVGFKGVVPLWLDEGVAQWTEAKKREQVKKLVREMFLRDGLLTMKDMMELRVDSIRNTEKVYIRPTLGPSGKQGLLFMTGNNLVAAYYMQAVSLVDFLIERFGKTEFANFCRALRDGKTMQEALAAVYADHIRGLGDLDVQWKDYIVKEGGA